MKDQVRSCERIIPFEIVAQLRAVAERLAHAGNWKEAATLAAAIGDLVAATSNPGFYANNPHGVCPFCGECEALIAREDKTFGVCHEHRLFWLAGAAILPAIRWRGEVPVTHTMIPQFYTQIAIEHAFPTSVCACCGLYRTHTFWCIESLSPCIR